MLCPWRQQGPQSNFWYEDRSKGHKVIDIDGIWKGNIS